MSAPDLGPLFHPRSVAVLGASRRPGSVGGVVMQNLLAGAFEGPILPVNPKYEAVRGVIAYRGLQDLPLVPELAVLCTPAATVPGLIRELASMGTRAAVVLTAGLAAARDGRGRPLDEAMLEAAGASGLRILGPNSVGLIAPHAGLNASFAQASAAPGRLAFVSQSGALCTAVLGWAAGRGLGFSAFLSLGDSKDVDFGDVIDHLGRDASTHAILLYIESLRDARKFLAAARAASRTKPIVAIKAGRGTEGQAAAASHTGALAGSDELYDHALRRAGVLRVDRIDELFDAAETVEHLDPITGSGLTILTNGGGPGVMATDALAAGGGRLTRLSDETTARLDRLLPPTWSRRNPVDLIGDATAARYLEAARVLAEAPEVESLLVIHAPTAVVRSADAARAVLEGGARLRGRLLASWLGGPSAAEARRLLGEAGVPVYETPESAIQAFLHLSAYHRGVELLAQAAPPTPADEPRGVPEHARALVERTLQDEPVWLDEVESKQLLAAYDVPIVESRHARDGKHAAALASELGFPVALKVRSPDVLHKSDVGGVVLDLETPAAVEEAALGIAARLERFHPGARLEGFSVQVMARRPLAHELFVGGAVDPIFGPFVMFGHGGTAVEVIADTAVALPPLNALLSAELVSRTRISRLLGGYRDRPPVDLARLHRLLAQVARLLAEIPEVVELDVNPVLADAQGVVALDARVRLARAHSSGQGRLALRT